jgi:hypothetical protein
MSESNAISGHGVAVLKGGVPITELRDVVPPTLTREVIEVTRQSDTDERNKVGIRQYGDLRLEINLLLTDPTHLDLIDAWVNATIDDFEIQYPDGTVWAFDGFVINVAPESPVDGVQSAAVVIRPTGGIAFNPLLETEDEELLTTEDGETFEI